MFVLFVSRMQKVFVVREATCAAAYEPPEEAYPDVSTVDDSIQGRLDTFVEIARIAKEEGWWNYTIVFEKATREQS